MQVQKIKSFSDLFIDEIFEYTFVTFEYEQIIGIWFYVFGIEGQM